MDSIFKCSHKTGEYEELREKINKLVALGFKIQGLVEYSGTSTNSIYDWLKRGRNLNHNTALRVQEYLEVLKGQINEIL